MKKESEQAYRLSVDERAALNKATAEIVGLAALDLIEKMRPSTLKTERVCAVIYLNIVESFQACNILVRAKMETHAALHIRAMLESFVNMTMLRNRTEHLRQMEHDKLDGEYKICSELLEDPHLTEESQQKLRIWLARVTPEREALRKANYRKKVVSKMITEANLPFLAVPYLTLNSMAHWDLAVLSERHGHKNGGLRVFAETTPEVVIALLSEAVKIMVMATNAVKDVAIFEDGLYESVFERMNKAWATLLNEI